MSDLIIRLEYFLDPNPQAPQGFERFLSRLAILDPSQWATIVCDSVTYMETAARMQAKYSLNPTTRDPRQWWSYSTDAMEEVLQIRFGSLPTNVIVNAHIDSSKVNLNGATIFSASAPGRLSKGLAAGYAELYHLTTVKVDDTPTAVLQTHSDEMFAASTQYDVPNMSPPAWPSLGLPPSEPVHVLIYGDSGAGKSTFAATAPKPMLVLFWDPFGKDRPYLKRGLPGPLSLDPKTGITYREVFKKPKVDAETVLKENLI